jgi:hypothetical protein
MHYHRTARESWLHERTPGYDNLTYQRALQKLPSRAAQYIFEMENSSANTLREMADWPYGRANCLEARYEDLRQDSGLGHWRRIVDLLGLDAQEQALAGRRFWQNSLFGGLSRLGNPHIRSGAVGQWRREFTPELGQAFLKRFPGLLQSLDYETSDTWVRVATPAGAEPAVGPSSVRARALGADRGARAPAVEVLTPDRSRAPTSRWRGPSS